MKPDEPEHKPDAYSQAVSSRLYEKQSGLVGMSREAVQAFHFTSYPVSFTGENLYPLGSIQYFSAQSAGGLIAHK